MKIPARVSTAIAALTGRYRLVKTHVCPSCEAEVAYVTRRQVTEWERVRRNEPWMVPVLFHSCGTSLQCEGRRPSTITELIGENR